MMTSTLSSASIQREQDIFRTISLTALLTGILDCIAAIIKFYIDTERGATLALTTDQEPVPVSFFTFIIHGGPGRIFKYIASGVFGQQASTGGTLMITWGIVFHFMIAFFFTLFLFLIYPKAAGWIKNKFITGIVYGLFTWAVMNLLVVPLSITHKLQADPVKMIIDASVLICMIGMPVALMAHRYHSRKKTSRHSPEVIIL